MSDTEEIPTVKAELERKTVELLENLVYRTEGKRMSQDDLNMVAGALWTVTSGLVSGDVSDLCAAAANAAKPRKLTRSFIGKGSVITVMWLPDSAGYLIVSRNATTLVKTPKPVKAEIDERQAALTKLFGALIASGYEEL